MGGKRSIASLPLATGAVVGILASSATAGRMQIYDACGGVDHPPFDRQYDGDGASFLLSAFAFDPSITSATAMVTGEGLDESVPLDIGPDGLADMAVGIFSFGTYPGRCRGLPTVPGDPPFTKSARPGRSSLPDLASMGMGHFRALCTETPRSVPPSATTSGRLAASARS